MNCGNRFIGLVYPPVTKWIPQFGDCFSMTVEQKFTFFWHTSSPFSQWYPSKFEVDGVLYTHAEQYMMHRKALLFGDQETALAILKAQHPRKMKSLGRKVKNFSEEVWTEHRERIVREASEAKFRSCPALTAALLSTSGTLLVEASPLDQVWGIGLAADDPRARDPRQWQGENLLGKALTAVRDQLERERGGM